LQKSDGFVNAIIIAERRRFPWKVLSQESVSIEIVER
jgi:hypothetical protein